MMIPVPKQWRSTRRVITFATKNKTLKAHANGKEKAKQRERCHEEWRGRGKRRLIDAFFLKEEEGREEEKNTRKRQWSFDQSEERKECKAGTGARAYLGTLFQLGGRGGPMADPSG